MSEGQAAEPTVREKKLLAHITELEEGNEVLQEEAETLDWIASACRAGGIDIKVYGDSLQQVWHVKTQRGRYKGASMGEALKAGRDREE